MMRSAVVVRMKSAHSPEEFPHDSLKFWYIFSSLATLVGLGLPLVGTILGWIGVVQIRGSRGTMRGTGLGLFAGLFYPLVLLMVLLIALIALIFTA